jgi:ATP-binding cassette, subfamily C, bacteriocin exporter
MRRGSAVKQHDVTDCGAACLASVARHYDLRVPISRIRQFASTDRKGTTVLGLIEAATRLGFVAKGVKGPFESLASIPLPAIAHVVIDGQLQHYVVVYGFGKRHVAVMDPMLGRLEKLPQAIFRDRFSGVLVLLVPGDEFVAGDRTVRLGVRFWSLVRPHRTVMGEALVGAAAYTLLGLTTAIYVQKLVDFVLVDGNRNLLNLMSVVMIALLFAHAFIGTTKDLYTLRTGQKIDATLILGYYRHLLRLPQQFFDTMRVGEIISRVNDAVRIRTFINDAALDVVVNVFVVVFSFSLMFLYSATLALVMLSVVPVYAAAYWLTNRINRTTQRRLMENAAELESQLIESLNAVSTIKRFGVEHFAYARTERRFVRLLKSVYRSGRTSILSGNSAELVSRLSTIVVLWVGAGLVIDRYLTPGELMSFYALVGFLTTPIAGMIAMNRTVQDAMIAADRLFEIMDLEREPAEQKIHLAREDIGDIHVQELTFRYGSRAPVFDQLNLHVPLGRITAIVGESGSGKSTLVSLLLSTHAPAAGHIRMGRFDLRHVSPSSLRRWIGVVPQEVHLFDGSVIDNVALGEHEPDIKRVLDVCTEVGITGMIEELPNGFHTHLGENGRSLSGGQRQRLAVARALYRDPEILILDEATSSLDSISESYVQRITQDLRRRGKTVVIIAHRLSSVSGADRIIVLANGSVAEEGTHLELLSRRGRYHRLWQTQVGPRMAPEPPPAARELACVEGAAGLDLPLPQWLRELQ